MTTNAPFPTLYELREKPPLGIKPRFVWLEQRAEEIYEAIKRYKEAGKEVPNEWYIEFFDVKVQLRNLTND